TARHVAFGLVGSPHDSASHRTEARGLRRHEDLDRRRARRGYGDGRGHPPAGQDTGGVVADVRTSTGCHVSRRPARRTRRAKLGGALAAGPHLSLWSAIPRASLENNAIDTRANSIRAAPWPDGWPWHKARAAACTS